MKIIVSLTSYPERIDSVNRVIKTLLIQNRQPDKVILWLAESQFPKKEEELPQKLLNLKDYGLDIRWCEDLKSHKKYFYVMQEFPDDIVITVDDDAYYSPRLIETLYDSYLKYPDAVSCCRANRIVIDEGGNTSYKKWEISYRECFDKKAFDLLAVGMGGVLYPPHCLPAETFDKEIINAICLYQDDIWLKAMEVKNNVPTVLAIDDGILADIMKEESENGLYNTINMEGNDIAINRIFKEIDVQTGQENFIIKKLLHTEFSVNCVLKKRDEHRKKVEQKFYDKIRNKKLVIYGAGTGADMVMDCLLSLENPVCPYAFVVSDKKDNPKYLFEIPVLEIGELTGRKDDYYVIVSTAERWHKDIGEMLKKLDFNNTVFIQDKVMGKILSARYNIHEAHANFASSLREKEYMQ